MDDYKSSTIQTLHISCTDELTMVGTTYTRQVQVQGKPDLSVEMGVGHKIPLLAMEIIGNCHLQRETERVSVSKSIAYFRLITPQ